MARAILVFLATMLVLPLGLLAKEELGLQSRTPGTHGLEMIGWQPGPSMSTGRSNFGALVADGYVLAMGGSTSAGLTATIERYRIQADGSLGRWATYYNWKLPLALGGFALVVSNGFAYVLGGSAGEGPLPLVEYAPIRNGEIQRSAWKFASSIPEDNYVRSPTAVAVKGYLFVFYTGPTQLGPTPTYQSRAQRATMNPDGSLSPWVSLGDLGIAGVGAAVSYGDYIYLMGGYFYHSGSSAVYRLKVNADGSLGALEAMPPMNVPRDSLSAVLLGQTVYVAGGDNRFYIEPASITAERAPIAPDGNLSSWEMLPAFNTQRLGVRLAAAGSSVYALGGVDGVAGTTYGQPLSSTERLWLAPYNLALPLILKGTGP